MKMCNRGYRYSSTWPLRYFDCNYGKTNKQSNHSRSFFKCPDVLIVTLHCTLRVYRNGIDTISTCSRLLHNHLLQHWPKSEFLFVELNCCMQYNIYTSVGRCRCRWMADFLKNLQVKFHSQAKITNSKRVRPIRIVEHTYFNFWAL